MRISDWSSDVCSSDMLAHPDNAYRLLREQQQLALVFPEGTKGTGKHVSERYRLRRFGRGGFVQIAMRAGVPVIPIAVVGAEEAMPILYKSPALANSSACRTSPSPRSEEHTSELKSLMRNSYAVFCLQNKN